MEVLLRNQHLLCRVQNSLQLETYVLPFNFLNRPGGAYFLNLVTRSAC